MNIDRYFSVSPSNSRDSFFDLTKHEIDRKQRIERKIYIHREREKRNSRSTKEDDTRTLEKGLSRIAQDKQLYRLA